MSEQRFEAVPVTAGGPHYFGYYDIQPFNEAMTHLLVLHPPFADREPTADDVCEIGIVELATKSYEKLTDTRAWNFQQGCFLHWDPKAANDVILYNDRYGDRFVCVEQNIQSGARRILPRPISAIDREGKRATSLNFSRLAVTRPGYGYEGVPDKYADDIAPDEDGVWVMDLETGDLTLAVSLAQARDWAMDFGAGEAKSWFNHNIISDDGERFILLHRYVRPGDAKWLTGCFAADMADGGNVRKLVEYGLTSHYDWYKSEAMLAWAIHRGDPTGHFWLIPDSDDEPSIILRDEWTRDGHCSYSPDYEWILNDTYPQGESREQHLMIYRERDGKLVQLGKFPHRGPRDPASLRCDLHPRFSRDGNSICFDSTHSGERQVYVMDVGEVTGR